LITQSGLSTPQFRDYSAIQTEITIDNRLLSMQRREGGLRLTGNEGVVDVRSNRREEGGSSVITANRLLDGRTVWLAASGWVEHIADATCIPNDEIEVRIETTRATQQATGVVGVYGVQLLPETASPEPRTARERIRAFGPSVHPEFAFVTQEGQPQ